MSNAIAAALHNKSLQLIVLPTEKCNFRCTYCYETFEIGKMKPPVVAAVKRMLARRIEGGSLEHLNITWFGGEPLLAKEIVLDIGRFAHQFLLNGQLKSYYGDVTTNGYLLTPTLLADLAAARQTAYQISLDGFGEGHDRTRRYASGGGTFATIWKNLLGARDSCTEFHISLRCHMNSENVDSMTQLIDEICKEFAHDERFSVFFKPIENLGGPNSKSIVPMSREVAYALSERLANQLKAAGLQSSACIDGPESTKGASAIAADPVAASPAVSVPARPLNKYEAYSGYVCYAAKPNSLMLRADGSIGKCTVLLDDPRNRIGKINPDGTLQLDSELVSSVWMRGFKSLDPIELGCPAQNLPRLPKEAKLEDLRKMPIVVEAAPA